MIDATKSITADIIIKGNAIFTVKDKKLMKGGIAVKGNKIIAVKNYKDINRYISTNTEVYDFGDYLIMPGFVDGHDHLWWGAVADSDHMVDLTSSTSEEEAVCMIKDYADCHPEEIRIRGYGWFPANWKNSLLPSKNSLDSIIPDRPVYMNCADAHTCWLNSLALKESGYHTDMKIKSGSVGIDENGELNGLVYEPEALSYAWEKMYDFPEEQMEEIMESFMKGLAAYGVTSLSEMSADEYSRANYDRYKVFKRMAEAGKFTSRVHVYTALMGYTDFSDAKKLAKEFSSDVFRVSGLKGFLDGVTSTYTGFLKEEYADKPGTCGEGVPLVSKEDLEDSVVAANAAGLPVRIHCIADGSVKMALDAFEASEKVNGRHGLKNSIEHIETIDPEDIKRFAKLGVIASMQGEHLALDNNEKIIRVGRKRCRWAWPMRSILDSGVTLALGTDFPVVHYNQFPGIYAAVTRKNYDGSHAGIRNKENITLAEALIANTLGSATVYNREHELGTLEAGKLADIIVIDRNLFEVDSSQIKDARIVFTMMDGKVTFRAEKG